MDSETWKGVYGKKISQRFVEFNRFCNKLMKIFFPHFKYFSLVTKLTVVYQQYQINCQVFVKNPQKERSMNVHNWKIFQMWTFTIGRSSKWVFTKISKTFEMNFWWRPSHFQKKKQNIGFSIFFQKARRKACWISVLLNLQKLISWFFCKRRRPTLFLPLNLDENFTKVVPQTEIEYLLLLRVVEIRQSENI